MQRSFFSKNAILFIILFFSYVVTLFALFQMAVGKTRIYYSSNDMESNKKLKKKKNNQIQHVDIFTDQLEEN